MRDYLRVVYVLNQLRLGGLENVAIDLANCLNPDRFDCTVVSFFAPIPLQEKALRGHVNLVTFNKKPGNDPSLIYRLYRYLRMQQVDIVQTHNWGTLLEGFWAAKFARVPAVVHAEHGTVQEGKGRVAIQRWTWSRLQQVLGVSEAHRSRLVDKIGFPYERIKIINNGIDTARFRPRSSEKNGLRKNLGLCLERLYIGTVGSMRPVKNQQMLLRGVARVSRTAEQLGLVFVGSGPLQESLVQLAKDLGIYDNVHFLGERDDIPDILNALDIFALPSLSEAMPLSLLEAMSCGLPVVATTVGGIPEIIEHGRSGLLVPSQDEEKLITALTELVEDKAKRYEIGQAARRAVQERYTVAHMVGEYEALYHELMDLDRCPLRS